MSMSASDLGGKAGGVEYHPEYCQAVVSFCGQGYSLTAFAGRLGVSRDDLVAWELRYPEFQRAVLAARAAATRFFEYTARAIAINGGEPGAATMTAFYLRALAPEEFARIRESTAKRERLVAPRITSTMTAAEAAEAFYRTLQGMPVEGEDEDEAPPPIGAGTVAPPPIDPVANASSPIEAEDARPDTIPIDATPQEAAEAYTRTLYEGAREPTPERESGEDEDLPFARPSLNDY